MENRPGELAGGAATHGADLLQELASKQGLQAIISPQVKAVVSGDFQSVATSAMLDTLCEVGNCTWFYDGGKIYVDAADEVLTRTLVVNALTRKSLEDALRSVGFASGPVGRESLIKGADRPGLLLLAGGPRYIQATEIVARELDARCPSRWSSPAPSTRCAPTASSTPPPRIPPWVLDRVPPSAFPA
ncbi:hypothetical protein [Verrucomicrobium spinosum]|uniref:hypothetical protein n=1 Tax=Verrucomicrobium spinosum TaxID=2736 RepID=UPI000A91DBB1|nr:hypothetical protein [Verrucomicrobium spinosum]